MKRVYLDYAAATPMDARVVETMEPYLSEQFHNPSALYQEARIVRSATENARSAVARLVGARPSEIIFTAGGTESDNLAIRGVMDRFPGKELIISGVEHDAVYEPAQAYRTKVSPVSPDGLVSSAGLEKLITDDTVLISVIYANNEIGTIQPLSEIHSLLRGIRQDRQERGVDLPLYFHTDACQAPMYLDVNAAGLGVDLMTLNGGKMHGPKQSGVLYVKAGIDLVPLILGGGQEFGIRSGTENVAGAVGFAKALELAFKGRADRVRKVSSLRDELIGLLETEFGAVLNGSRKHRIANNVHVTFPNTDNERVLFALDDLGIAAATGSACSASKDEPSRVLSTLGLSDAEARASLRFTLGKDTKKTDLEYLLKVLPTALKA